MFAVFTNKGKTSNSHDRSSTLFATNFSIMAVNDTNELVLHEGGMHTRSDFDGMAASDITQTIELSADEIDDILKAWDPQTVEPGRPDTAMDALATVAANSPPLALATTHSEVSPSSSHHSTFSFGAIQNSDMATTPGATSKEATVMNSPHIRSHSVLASPTPSDLSVATMEPVTKGEAHITSDELDGTRTDDFKAQAKQRRAEFRKSVEAGDEQELRRADTPVEASRPTSMAEEQIGQPERIDAGGQASEKGERDSVVEQPAEASQQVQPESVTQSEAEGTVPKVKQIPLTEEIVEAVLKPEPVRHWSTPTQCTVLT